MSYRYTISGVVQGVFFRVSTKQKADELGIFGYVQNLQNGSVEVYVEGNPENRLLFEQWLHTGPKMASIEKVIKEDLEDVFHTTTFEVRR